MSVSFVSYGIDVVSDPALVLQPGGGNDGAGQITLTGGSQLFDDGKIVEFFVSEVSADGEIMPGAQITGIKVYANLAEYQAGTVLYDYSPTTPGEYAPTQADLEGMGDTYLRFDASVLVSGDAGAPVLGDMFVAPGADANDAYGSLTLDRDTDVDLDGDGMIQGGTTEEGNTWFNINLPDHVYGPMPDHIVSGTGGDDWIDTFYTDDPQGDLIDAGDAPDLSDDDHVQAGDGNDTVLAGLGDDLVEGGAGHDQLEGGEGNDTLYGNAGNDRMYGNDGDDVGYGGAGNDTFEGNYGSDYFEGGAGDDSILGDVGDDTLIGGAGNDWLRGSVGNDSMSGGTGDDYIWSGFQDDTISLEDNFGNDTIEMEDIDETTGDVLDASAVTSDLTVDLRAASAGVGTLSDGVSTAHFEGVEHLILGSGDHTIVLGQTSGVDVLQGFTAPTDNGDGTFTGHDVLDLTDMINDDGDLIDTADVTVSDDGAGNAVLSFPGGEGLTLIGIAPSALGSPAALHAIGIPLAPVNSDGVVEGTSGGDLIDDSYAGDPDGDVVDGADGDDDLIEAGAGDDTIDGGAGNDTMRGGGGDDTFTMGAQGGTSNTIDGGEDGETLGDTLNIIGPATITYDPLNAENGTVEWRDGTTLSFENIENVNYVPCFTPTALIKTARGEKPAGLLQPGDLILTRDNGMQPITWIGARALSRRGLSRAPDLRPVLIRKGALGGQQPERDLMVSPQHRMLVSSRQAALWFGEPELFVPAIALTCLPGVKQVRAPGVTYVHFMMERHQVVMGDGAWSESFQPGDRTLAGMDPAQRAELFTLFPELADENPLEAYPAARVTLSSREARGLLG